MPVKFIAEVVKGLFGISDSRTTDTETETNITVERETGDGPTGRDDDGSAESEPAETKRVEDAGETVVDIDDAETELDTDDEGVDEVAESVEAVTGIGPTYGGRLADAGIGTVAELAETEPEEVAEVAEVSESRATDFVRKARER